MTSMMRKYGLHFITMDEHRRNMITRGQDEWYFNPQFMEMVPKRLINELLKGDEMSKRTEISYRNIKNVNPRGESAVEFVGYKNVMTLAEIDKEIGNEVRTGTYCTGRSYFQSRSERAIVIFNRKENILAREYLVGKTYSPSDWHFFIDFLLEAGERYGEIKADIKESAVQKILI